MNRFQSHSPATERGAVLVITIMVILTLAGLSIGLLGEGLAESSSLQQRKSDLVALQICEAGIIRATMEIYALKDSGTDGIGTVSGTYADGTYEVTAQQDPTHPDRWTLQARGEQRLSVKRIEAGIRRRESSDFVEGLFAKDTLTFTGSTTTDAFDSRKGTWAAQALNTDAAGLYAEDGGHVGSNQNIFLNGSSITVRGNAIPGPTSTTQLAGDPTVWGDVVPRRIEIELPEPTQAEFDAAFASNNNAELLPNPGGGAGGGGGPPGQGGGGGGSAKSVYNERTFSLVAKGQEAVSLSGGTYFFQDVSFTGQSKLTIDGPTVIYLTGSFEVAGGSLLNVQGDPKDLIIYAHPYAVGGLPALIHKPEDQWRGERGHGGVRSRREHQDRGRRRRVWGLCGQHDHDWWQLKVSLRQGARGLQRPQPNHDRATLLARSRREAASVGHPRLRVAPDSVHESRRAPAGM